MIMMKKLFLEEEELSNHLIQNPTLSQTHPQSHVKNVDQVDHPELNGFIAMGNGKR